MTLFVMGLYLSGGRCVYASWVPQDFRWNYILQAGVGLPAAPAAIQWYRDSQELLPLWNGWMAKPRSMSELSDWHLETSAGFDLGTLYTMIAGLLNILIVFDACSGPLALPTHDSRNKKT